MKLQSLVDIAGGAVCAAVIAAWSLFLAGAELLPDALAFAFALSGAVLPGLAVIWLVLLLRERELQAKWTVERAALQPSRQSTHSNTR